MGRVTGGGVGAAVAGGGVDVAGDAEGGEAPVASRTLGRVPAADADGLLVRALLDAHDDAGTAVVVATARGRVEIANDAFLRLTGLSLVEIRGLPSVLQVISEEERGAFSARMRVRSLRAGTPARCRSILVTPLGRRIPIEVSVRGLTTGDDVRLLGVVRDLSEMEELSARVVEADRMATLGRRAAEVAHELTNPLSYTLANLDMLLRRWPEAGDEDASTLRRKLREMKPMLSASYDGAARIRYILRDLREMIRPEERTLESVDLRRPLEAAIASTNAERSDRARLETSLEGGAVVMGSERRLSQVFINLLVNALHALPADREKDNRITVRTRAEGRRAIAEVEDNGVGIAPENLGRIFEPFFTTKTVEEGTGLGLSICRAVVRSLGGEITIESTQGRGTLVRVSFPALGR
jgi:PAS domain S-box-containing protein